MAFCCWGKKNKDKKASSSVRSHQPLCQLDSGAVSITVQRVAGASVLRNLSHDSTSSRSPLTSPGIMQYAESPARRSKFQRESSCRNSPNTLLRNPGRQRLSPGQIRDSSRGSNFLPNLDEPGCRNSALESAICRFGRKFDEDGPTQNTLTIKSVAPSHAEGGSRTLGGGFELSSSFEGGLDKIDSLVIPQVVPGSERSSYDNLKLTNGDNGELEEERKQSLYDNIDDNVLSSPEAMQHLEETYTQSLLKPDASTKRRSSKTMPLRFTLFTGGQHNRMIDDSGGDETDQDYVNVPAPLSRDSQIRRSNPPKVNKHARNTNDKESSSKKKRYRRGSKPLQIICSKKAPILSKIEKQVLTYVPIMGEPTPEPITTTNNNNMPFALNDFTFPPPPDGSPPARASGAQDFFNPSYVPITATPRGSVDTDNPFNKPNAYFSF